MQKVCVCSCNHFSDSCYHIITNGCTLQPPLNAHTHTHTYTHTCTHTHAHTHTCTHTHTQVIAAEGEQKASKRLREAADVIDESPAALQLRYLQTLNTISSENNHTYVFPLPVDLLSQLFGNK